MRSKVPERGRKRATFRANRANAEGGGLGPLRSVVLLVCLPIFAEAAGAGAPTTSPANLRAVVGDGQLTFQWDAVTDATGYRYRLKADSAAWGQWTAVAGAGTSHTAENLTNGTTYWFKVRAVNGGRKGPVCPAVSATPTSGSGDEGDEEDVEGAPSASPANLRVSDAGDFHLTFAWDAVADATGYRYRIRTDSGQWGDWTPTAGGGTSHTAEGLASGTTHWFKVRAAKGARTGPSCPAVSAATTGEAEDEEDAPGPPADAPANLRVSDAGDFHLTFAWDAVADATGYRYRIRTDSGQWGDWTPTAGGGTSHTAEGLASGTTHWFKVRAAKGARTGPSCPAVSAATTGEAEDEEDAPGPPADAPANLRVSDAGDFHLTFAWDAVADATGYRYRIRTDSGQWGDWTPTAGGGTSHTAEGLASGTTHWFKVRAAKGARTGPSCPAVSAATTGEAEDEEDAPGPPADAPANLRVSDAGDFHLTFAWDAVADATGYRYRIRTDSGQWGDWTPTAGGGTSHTAEGLASGTTHWFKVRAAKGARTGPSCPAVSAATTGEAEDEEDAPGPPADAPANLRVSDAGDFHLTFAWDAVADATGYRYRIRTDSGQWGDWTPTAGGGTSHTAEGLASGTTHWFKVRAAKGARTGPSCPAVSAATTGEAETEEDTPVTRPDAPANLRVSSVGDAHLTFEWDAVANATGYRYRIRTDSGAWGPWTSTAAGGHASHTAEALASGTTYWFKVRAEYGRRTGPSCVAISADTSGLSAPRGFTATPGDQSVELRWQAPAGGGVTHYEVRRGVGEPPSFGPWRAVTGPWREVVDTGKMRHTVGGLANGFLHTFEIRAIGIDGAGQVARSQACLAESPETPVAIEDVQLSSAIARALGKTAPAGQPPPASASTGAASDPVTITQGEMATLTHLDLRATNIANLAGLSYASNLQSLLLRGNRVSNLEPIVGLQFLSSLDLGANSLSDISALARMPALERLWLNDNAIADISPLVANAGLGEGDIRPHGSSDYVDLRGNPLNSHAVVEYAPLLRERGAAVLLDDGAHLVPFFAPAGDHRRQSFARIVNPSDQDGEVSVTAVDVQGRRFGPVTLPVGPREAVHFNSDDLEFGNAAKGMSPGVGVGEGDWRLELRSSLPVDVFAYMRAADGVVTGMTALAPEKYAQHRIAMFNPGSNGNQASSLRVINTAGKEARVLIEGVDDRGTSNSVPLTVPAGGTREFTAAALEEDGLGDGAGKWRITATSYDGVLIVNVLDSPAGQRANLSLEPRENDGDVQHLPLLPAAVSSIERESFVRVLNHSPHAGTVRVWAVGADGNSQAAGTLTLEARGAAHFNSRELEGGNADKGLTGLAVGRGDWRLELRSDLAIGVYGYTRAAGGFLTSIHERVPVTETGAHRVVYFNPAGNTRQASRLRVVNASDNAADVRITGVDDAGDAAGTAVRLTIPARGTRELTAQELETGEAEGVVGALGEGSGKWRLLVESNNELAVMSLLADDAGHLTNLSR